MKRVLFFGLILAAATILCTPGIALGGDPVVDQIQKAIDSRHGAWVAGETSISALTRQELQSRLGLMTDMEAAYLAGLPLEEPTVILAAAPSAMDWRSSGGQNWTTPIKDQGACGSCVAFATNAAMESRIEIGTGNAGLNPNLSESHLYACGGPTCSSGWWVWAAMNLARDQGVADETCFPYAPRDVPCSPCSDWQNRVTKLSSWWGTSDATLAKQAIAQGGPVVVTMDIYADFAYYSGGVYQHTWGDKLGGHAVAIVGYDDVGGYWIAKNSWGAGWGDGGWFRIAYGDSDFDDYFYVPEVAIDNVPPAVDNIRISPEPMQVAGCPSGTTASIQASVSDPSGLASVRLYFMPPGSDSWSFVTMDNPSGGTWTSSVGPFGGAGAMSYFIRAIDFAGNRSFSDERNVTVNDCSLLPPTATPTPTASATATATPAPSDTQPPAITGITEAANPINKRGCPAPTTVAVQASVTDPSGLASVRLYFMSPGSASWSFVPMDNPAGNTWGGAVGPFADSGVLTYFIRAIDLVGNRSFSDQLTVAVNDCSVATPTPTSTPAADTDPPIVANMQVSSNPINCAGCPEPTTATIQATITDPSDLASVRLYFRSPGSTSWSFAHMDNTAGNAWSGVIGPVVRSGDLTYFIRAIDLAGNRGFSDQLTVAVNDCSVEPPTATPTATSTPSNTPAGDTEPPVVTNVQVSSNPINTAGCADQTTVTIQADITDPSGLSSVRLYFKPPGADSWSFVPMDSAVGDRWDGAIGPFAQSGELTYFIRTIDFAGNRGFTEELTVTVSQCAAGIDSQFNGSAGNWETHSGPWAVDSDYYRSTGAPGRAASASYAGEFGDFDYQVETMRTGCNNCGSGFTIRGVPLPLSSGDYWARSYLFQYTRWGSYSVWKTVDGMYTPLQYWTYSPAIRSYDAWNTLRIVASGSSLQFYINGSLVWSGQDTQLTSGRVGLSMYKDPDTVNDLLSVNWAQLVPLSASDAGAFIDTIAAEQISFNQLANERPRVEGDIRIDFAAASSPADANAR